MQTTVPPPMSLQGQLGRRLSTAAVALTFLVAFVAHAAYVHMYGVDIPIWDEWGAEGYYFLKAWAEGHLTLHAWITPWNEHRIFFSRLVTLATFELSRGTWSVLRTQYVNAAIYAAIPALLMRVVTRAPVSRRGKLFVAVVILAMAVLPYAWENTLGAFQNQFYFMILALLAALFTAASGTLSVPRSGALLLIAVAGIFTMAPGVVTGAAAALVLVCRAWLGQVSWRRAVPLGALLLAITVAGYLTTPVLPGPHPMKAQSLLEFVHVFVRAMAWPATSPHAGMVLCWIPATVGAWMLLRRRWATPADVVMLGLAAWTVVQAAGIALSRGHDLVVMTPRYLDVLAMGVVANAWFATRLATHGAAGRLRHVPAFLFGLVVAQGFIAAQPDTLRQMAQRRDQMFMQRTHIMAYLRTGVPAELEQPVPATPLPDAAQLHTVLDDPTIRRMLLPLADSTPSAH